MMTFRTVSCILYGQGTLSQNNMYVRTRCHDRFTMASVTFVLTLARLMTACQCHSECQAAALCLEEVTDNLAASTHPYRS
jgi:hypothetical protein